jgi:hypothetical protein
MEEGNLRKIIALTKQTISSSRSENGNISGANHRRRISERDSDNLIWMADFPENRKLFVIGR